MICLFSLHSMAAYPIATGKDDARIVTLDMNYRIRARAKTEDITFIILIPRTIARRQTVLNTRFSYPPERIFDLGDNRYAEFRIADMPYGKEIHLNIGIDMILERYDLTRAYQGQNDSPGREGERYLRSEIYLEKNDPEIQRVAQYIGGDNEIDTIRKIYDYVMSQLEYRGYVSEDVGAVKCLFERKYGDCSDFSDVLVTLCRARNIPARIIDGCLTDYSNDNPRHTWVEIYTKEFGWIPFDPLLGRLGQVSFDRLPSKYIYLSNVRNDRTLGNFHFYSCGYSKGSLSVKDQYRVTTVDNTGTVVLKDIN